MRFVFFADALKIVENEFGKNHYKFGMMKASAGSAKVMLGDFAGSYQDLQAAMRTLKLCLGATHLEVADVLTALGDVCIKTFVENPSKGEKLSEAKKYYVEAESICVLRLGKQHSKVDQLASLLFICDNYAAIV